MKCGMTWNTTGLIEQSIAKQYRVLPSEQGDLRYSDWIKMVSGLMDDTPLGRIVMIRSETDKERIKIFLRSSAESNPTGKGSVRSGFSILIPMITTNRCLH